MHAEELSDRLHTVGAQCYFYSCTTSSGNRQFPKTEKGRNRAPVSNENLTEESTLQRN